METCPHGLEIGSGMEGIAWAGGIGHCACHKGAYGTIGSSMVIYNGDGSSYGSSQTPPEDLCYECGGTDTYESFGVAPEEITEPTFDDRIAAYKLSKKAA